MKEQTFKTPPEDQKPIKAKPHFYSVCFEGLQKIARDMGYNLLIHGSINRDMDLVAIAWIDKPQSHTDVLKAFSEYLGVPFLTNTKKEPCHFKVLPGGRINYIINLNRGGRFNGYLDAEYYLDISFTPSSLEQPSGTVSQYQLCPKCNGEGKLPNTGTSSIFKVCDVCNGYKMFVRPVIYKLEPNTGETAREFIYRKYPHLKIPVHGKNPVVDFELNELCKWFEEYASQPQPKVVLPTEEDIEQEIKKSLPYTEYGNASYHYTKGFNDACKWLSSYKEGGKK